MSHDWQTVVVNGRMETVQCRGCGMVSVRDLELPKAITVHDLITEMYPDCDTVFVANVMAA